MSEFEFLLLDKDPKEHIAKITLNRPEKLNAIHKPFWREIIRAFEDAEEDESIKVVILKGAGTSFSTGGDLAAVGRLSYDWKEPKHGEKPQRPSMRHRMLQDRFMSQKFFPTIMYCNKVTIAQVHGYCLGGGFEIMMACDMCVASEDAVLGHPGVRNIGPFYQHTPTLWIMRLGVTLAKEMQFTGRSLSAQEAFQRQIINKVVPLERLEAETMRLAQGIALMPADGIVMGKTIVNAALDNLGLRQGANTGGLGHSLFTNIHYEPDEFNFWKSRRDVGDRQTIHLKDERFRPFIDNDALFGQADKDAHNADKGPA
ncbi:MAG: enoyl-CoA hydratase/isomerase family protein [Chloroflexi bacterium]|nr:enoyl-CoA hydratase/isomerase family protein [Chloroflexota bacterium]